LECARGPASSGWLHGYRSPRVTRDADRSPRLSLTPTYWATVAARRGKRHRGRPTGLRGRLTRSCPTWSPCSGPLRPTRVFQPVPWPASAELECEHASRTGVRPGPSAADQRPRAGSRPAPARHAALAPSASTSGDALTSRLPGPAGNRGAPRHGCGQPRVRPARASRSATPCRSVLTDKSPPAGQAPVSSPMRAQPPWHAQRSAVAARRCPLASTDRPAGPAAGPATYRIRGRPDARRRRAGARSASAGRADQRARRPAGGASWVDGGTQYAHGTRCLARADVVTSRTLRPRSTRPDSGADAGDAEVLRACAGSVRGSGAGRATQGCRGSGSLATAAQRLDGPGVTAAWPRPPSTELVAPSPAQPRAVPGRSRVRS